MAETRKKPLFHVSKKQNIQRVRRIIELIILYSLLSVNHGATINAPSLACNSNQYRCDDGSCILQEKMCDGRRDCPDNSDEANCDMKMCRKPNWFQCAQPFGPCLSSELICNGIDNCPGGDDEQDCVGRGRNKDSSSSLDIGTGGWHGSTRNCTKFEYTCQTDKICVPLDFMCDGKRDCLDGSDESAGCLKAEANCRGFFCANKKCLESKLWLCDGVDDCGDGSDEQRCANDCVSEQHKFRCRDNATCLDITKACDNATDCADGSDESMRCKMSNDCSTKICPTDAKCYMLPESGPVCVCAKGYRYSELRNMCQDVDECIERFDVCSQRCENNHGGYTCSCDTGYLLSADNKTCKVQNSEEPLLLYSTQATVMGVHLRSKRVFTVARNLTKVIGVAYDGDNIYWTNIQNEAESIVKAKPDGTGHEILLTSGLDAPEDLAVDWLTDNIYFSDNVMSHIAVCSNDGQYCAPLVTIDVHQPRGIALWPQRGQMFWTDWGTKPMIARASMDGSNSLPIVTENIHWPNGIALDMHNDRIYWVDAKLAIMESVRPDGTDRHVVLDQIMKHPYGIAVFEDKLYWSDWGTKSVHTCNKFTGKDHSIVVKDRAIYAVHIYHSAKQPRIEHACTNARCSHLCLLAENSTYTCACPDGMVLGMDLHRCTKTQKKQRLFIGIKSTLLEMEHTTFGRHVISDSHQLTTYINQMAYNSVNGTIFIADNIHRSISEFDIAGKKIATLVHDNLGNITGLAFDYLSHNIYWTDSERHVVEVFSLRTRQRAMVRFFSGVEAPIGLAIIPEDGIMFVALRARRHVHIDQLTLNGMGDHVHVLEDEFGDGTINFATEIDTQTLYWSDSDLGSISFTNYRKMHAFTFRSRLRRPYSIAIVDHDMFWTEMRSSSIYWTQKNNMGPVKRVEIEVTRDAYAHELPDRIPLLASKPYTQIDHPCQHSNGECSHVCVTLTKFASSCLCPAGYVFKDATNHTCIESLDCEFRCRSGECLTQSRRCNGRKDCPDGSDEEGCGPAGSKKPKVICSVNEFMCNNAEQCIGMPKRCDSHKDCKDNSDEQHCENFDKDKKCHRHQHACDNGNCVDFSLMCDGVDDCGDNSDEAKCKMPKGGDTVGRPVCGVNMFQCSSGTCISSSWECDGRLDCSDGSDEHAKCELKECPKEMHKCLLGQCIESRLVCDGHNDCGDMSDELNCNFTTGTKQKPTDCADGMFQCKSDPSICLAATAKCNSTAECPRGEDEAECGDNCSIYEFQCKTSRKCIRLDFRCDHEHDCSDGSDELNCQYPINGSTSFATKSSERACEANMYDCKDGKCVELVRVCDGYQDCATGADEGPLCNTACRSSSNRPICQHTCRPTPTGAICSCYQGYKLDVDQRSCVDINECLEIDPCAQICENTHGSYRCECYPDFMLRQDRTSCKSIESGSTLLFTSYNEVRSMSESPIVLRVAWSANDSKINGFDANLRKRKAYFSTDTEDILYEVDMDSGTIKAGLEVKAPTKVAVDWITDNVYVISRAQRYEIKVCSFKAKMCGRIITANAHVTIKALTIDAYNKRLFYVTIRSESFNKPLSQITIANLDGNKREMLYRKYGGYITALAVDPHKQLLYYVDLHTKTLESIDYKTGSVGSRTPTILIQKANAILHPSGLSIYENQAFIVNIGAKETVRCQLYGTRSCKAYNLNILNAEDVMVDGASRQPMNQQNHCDMAKCSGMCVQADYGYECMCGDSVVAEHIDCPKTATNEITTSSLLSNKIDTDSSNAQESQHGTALVITLSLLFVLLLAAGAGYLYYRRIKRGHRDLNINLHFQNPLSTLGSKSYDHSTYDSAASGGNRSNASGDSGSGNSSATGTTAASFIGERRILHDSVSSIQRFFRMGTQTNAESSEILLETATHEIHPMAEPRRVSSVLLESNDGGFDYNTDATTFYSGNGAIDDPNAKLVP